MASLPDWRDGHHRAAAPLVRWTSAVPALRPVTTAARPQDTLLWNAEVQYVCRSAARQSYGQQIRGSAAPL